ncbi:pectate lyase [Chytriomyces cf. hyalinus JEL632]|nr:pectate lyase [Chytriomyces cf. hyalinus JEL632]
MKFSTIVGSITLIISVVAAMPADTNAKTVTVTKSANSYQDYHGYGLQRRRAYHFCRQATKSNPKTTAATTQPTKPDGKVPAAQGSATYPQAQVIKAGQIRMRCRQTEGGDKDAVFLVEDGATVKNVIIGTDQIDGIHCLGSCTIQNVWWEDVCEDALTIKGDGNASVIGGGAFSAEDKVIQHNGQGTMSIDGFYVENFGKLYRSCGNCKKQSTRNVQISNVVAKLLAGITSDPYGDTAVFKNNQVTSVQQICTTFKGNSNGAEPTKLNSGIDGKFCIQL